MRIVLTNVDDPEATVYSWMVDGEQAKRILLNKNVGEARIWVEDEWAGRQAEVYHEHEGLLGTMELSEGVQFDVGVARRQAQIQRLQSEIADMNE